jgi:hypothetical protein
MALAVESVNEVGSVQSDILEVLCEEEVELVYQCIPAAPLEDVR